MIYELKEKTLYIKIDSLFNPTVQDFLDEFVPSKKYQHLLIQNKWIMIDGKAAKREGDLFGDKLSILIYPEVYSYKKLDKDLLDVVYEDEIMLVVNKPKGMLVHSDGGEEITLADMVESYLFDRPYISAIPIHRLDKETTGLVVFSKSIIFQPLLDSYLSAKQIRRNYLAFVDGIMEEGESLTINKPIGKDRHNPNKRIVFKDGQSALTKVKCIGSSKALNFSILRCILDTGRTHQIRVHLSSIGYPILNDDLYGKRSKLLVRMGLFADSLEMYHPLKMDYLTIETDLPKDLGRLYQEI